MKGDLRRRLDRIEERLWRMTFDSVDRYLHGRSMEDVEFFCVHGYLPEMASPGLPFEPPPSSWNERWKHFRESQRMAASKTVEEREFFCVNGYWPNAEPGGWDGEG